MTANLREVAFYYPGPIWQDAGWVKNLLLFFDGVALLVPSYIRDKPIRVGGQPVKELQDQGLLTILEPETFIDHAAARELGSRFKAILASGKLDSLGKEERRFDELSYSRLGGMVERELADELFEALKSRGLAKETEDGLSIPMHPQVRQVILALWAQILRPLGKKQGMDLQPATDSPGMIRSLQRLLDLPIEHHRSDVYSADLATVGVDLADAPLKKVLRFREAHGEAFQAYARDLRQFAWDLSLHPSDVGAEMLRDRSVAIRQEGVTLTKLARQAWAGRAAFAFGIVGAAWSVVGGNPVAAFLSGGAATYGALASGTPAATAHSYLFGARNALSSPRG